MDESVQPNDGEQGYMPAEMPDWMPTEEGLANATTIGDLSPADKEAHYYRQIDRIAGEGTTARVVPLMQELVVPPEIGQHILALLARNIEVKYSSVPYKSKNTSAEFIHAFRQSLLSDGDFVGYRHGQQIVHNPEIATGNAYEYRQYGEDGAEVSLSHQTPNESRTVFFRRNPQDVYQYELITDNEADRGLEQTLQIRAISSPADAPQIIGT